jgi:hypothetical protein
MAGGRHAFSIEADKSRRRNCGGIGPRPYRACHNHLSIRWRSNSLALVLKTALCWSVQAAV